MNLTTQYLGLTLDNPLIAGASPLVDDLDMVRRLADAGAGAIVMHSLFEEQLINEQLSAYSATEGSRESDAEASSYLPEPQEFHLGPEQYLRQIEKIKQSVSVPLIASLNGCSAGGWLDYARQIAQAGADALELNIYDLSMDPDEDAATIESRMIQITKAVKNSISIPIAVKIPPFYTAMAHLAGKLSDAGADGLVLFNRLYQPDIDIENLELHRVNPVGMGDLPLRLRWLGVLFGRYPLSLAASGGITTATEAIKAIMAGADAVQMVSALLLNGPEYLTTVRRRVEHWLDENEYESLGELRGSMSLHRCPQPLAYQRANYMKTLMSWRM